MITSAKLTLTSFAGFAYNGDPAHHAIFLSDDAWTESTTWSNKPSDGFQIGLPEPTINGVPLSSSPDNLGDASALDDQGCAGTAPATRDFASSRRCLIIP